MPFKPGDPKPKNAGRKPGTPNKKSLQLEERAAELGVDPFLFLAHFMMGDTKSLGEEPFVDDETGEETYPKIPLEDRREAAKELMPYLYGKRKPVDKDGDDSSDLIEGLISALANK